jgi:hypothetical protein
MITAEYDALTINRMKRRRERGKGGRRKREEVKEAEGDTHIQPVTKKK